MNRLEQMTDFEVALDLLRQYYKYAEEMRKIGRGFSPDCMGLTIEYFLQGHPEEVQP